MADGKVEQGAPGVGEHSRRRWGLITVILICSILAMYVVFAPIEQTNTLGSFANDSRAAVSRSTEADRADLSPQGATRSPDLPRAEIVAKITRRAVWDALHAYKGFMPSIIAVSDCYQHMLGDDLEQRIFCMQLDRAAWTVEKMAPPAWRAKDESANDYFTDLRFRQRQLHYAMPLTDAPEFVVHKQEFLAVLSDVLESAMRDEMEKEAASEREAVPNQIL